MFYLDLRRLFRSGAAALYSLLSAWPRISALSRHNHADRDAHRTAGDRLDDRSLVWPRENRFVADRYDNRHTPPDMASAFEGLQSHARASRDSRNRNHRARFEFHIEDRVGPQRFLLTTAEFARPRAGPIHPVELSYFHSNLPDSHSAS